MAYRLQSGESVPDGLRRVVCEELQSAASRLGQSTTRTRDDAIHEARKSLKKTRAILRLISSRLDRFCQGENRRFRNLGLRLSAYRDTAAMVETFDLLRNRYRDEPGFRALASVRRGLLEQKRVQTKGTGVVATIRRVEAALIAACRRIPRWPIGTEGIAAITPGLEEGYRRCRKAMRAARRHAKPEYCHEWRKRVKDHWYHVRLLEGFWPHPVTGYERSLKQLETWLGDHHNLEVLWQRISVRPSLYGSPETVTHCYRLIGRLQKELRRNALSLGERLYQERPRDFARRLAEQGAATSGSGSAGTAQSGSNSV